ncbi:hypothetical protein ACU8V4_04750 [Pseudoalteromonas mariniglutinosa]
MKLKFLCPYWGCEGTAADEFVAKVLDAGFAGAEINFPADEKFISGIQRAANEDNFSVVAQQWLAPKVESFAQYRAKFNARLRFLATLNPVFINSHTGKDFYSVAQNSLLLNDALALERTLGITITHETHRGRFNFAAFATEPYLKQFPALKLNADFSHWTNVSESYLEEQQGSLKRAQQHSYYIHARVGHTQSAQVNDPFSPQWQETLSLYVKWWQQIIDLAQARGQQTFYICPEFGPWPYMPNKLNSTIPLTQQWQLNVRMKEYLMKHLIV